MTVVDRVFDIIYGYSIKDRTDSVKNEICEKLSNVLNHKIYFCPTNINEIHGKGIDIFNLMIIIGDEHISLFKYLNNYDDYERAYKIRNIKEKINDK